MANIEKHTDDEESRHLKAYPEPGMSAPTFTEITGLVKDAGPENIGQTVRRLASLATPGLEGGRISVSFRDFRGKIPDFDINGDSVGWAASTIKVPVMIEAVRQISEGELFLQEGLRADHQKYQLEASDYTARARNGELVPVFHLMYTMIVFSDNESTNMLADRLGIENINKTCQDIGATRTMMGHLLGWQSPRFTAPFNPEGSNVTTANDLSKMMSMIYLREGIASEHNMRNMMIFLLENTTTKYIGIRLPKDTVVGSKVGQIRDFTTGDDYLDTAVVNRDFALTVMTNRVDSELYKRMKEWETWADAPKGAIPRFKKILSGFRTVQKVPRAAEEEGSSQIHLDASDIIGIIGRAVYNAYYKKE